MPTVPGLSTGARAQLGAAEDEKPTPERLLMTAADMHSRGQLTEFPTRIGQEGTDLKLPFAGGGRGPRSSGKKSKRR